jgi:predicted nucleotidyltransferase
MNASEVKPANDLDDIDEVRRLVLAGLSGYRVRVILFGSWATESATRTSDIDVAVLPIDPIPRYVLSEIRQALEDSNVLYPVDLVDISDSLEDFRARVLREGVLWSE